MTATLRAMCRRLEPPWKHRCRVQGLKVIRDDR